MHITCVICSDLFSPASDVYTTPCGHIFHYTCLLHWLENSKTCPQCRAKVSSKSLLRLFVNVANSEGPEADVTLLQHKLDSAEFNMKLRDQELKNIAEKNRDTQQQNKALRAQIKELELSEKRHESVAAAYKEQIKYFKNQAQNCSKLQDEITRLRNEVKNLEQVQVAVTGSRKQVDEIIKNENSIESLALLAATLKKSLIDTDRKKKELQFELKKTQNELSQHKRKMNEIEYDYEITKKQLESLETSYEKEVSYLKEKFSQLQAKARKGTLNDSVNDSIRRITSESPVNYNRTPVLSGHKDDTVYLDDSEIICNTPLSSATSQSLPDKKINTVVIEDSPLPASSMGLFGIQRAKVRGNNAEIDKFSIFKNRQPTSEPVVTRTNFKGVSVVYDGLGGCSKDDVFPTPPKKLKMSSNKFKKLSANAGKPNNKKISEFVNLT